MEDVERAAIEKFKVQDEKIDELVGNVLNNLDLMETGLLEMGEKIDGNEKIIQGVTENVDKVNQKFETTNDKLKKITENFRPARKMCTDICLILVLLVMLGILYNVIVKSY